MSFLDGLFSGISNVAIARAVQTFAKTINFVNGVTAAYNAATGQLDLTIAIPTSPSITIPIQDNGAGTVTVGSDPANGISQAFKVPNDDGSGFALTVDNAGAQVLLTILLSLTNGLKISGSYISLLSEVSAVSVATPATGVALYVDSADHKFKAKGRSGTVTSLANP